MSAAPETSAHIAWICVPVWKSVSSVAFAFQRALTHAAGFLRHQIRKQMRLRVAPELVFQVDESIERAARLSALIHDAVESDRLHPVEREPDAE